MKSTFRQYNNLSSSLFDLIGGDIETQQTKGLGLLLSKSELALSEFLAIKKIKDELEFDLSKTNQLIVNSELISTGEKKYRADILLRFYFNNQPYKAILIEAKRLNENILSKNAVEQLKNYIEQDVFEELCEFKEGSIYGVTLTKYPSIRKDEKITSITWSDLMSKYYYATKKADCLLLNDYFNFITNIKGAMKFYEREVFSIPTADWSNEAIQKFHIYECPNSGNYKIKYRPLFLTFRKSGGGEMDKLYKVDTILTINFKENFKFFLEDTNYPENIRSKVMGYVNFLQENKIWGKDYPSDDKQVFILSETNVIHLNHNPKPKRNNSFRAYYDLSELLSNKIVEAIK